MFRTAFLILSGNAGSAFLSLLRNLLIARLIPVEDYGIAATFGIAMTIIEMLSALGMQQQIVQAKNGDDPAFQAGLQGFQLARGIVSGAILFFAAGWIAAFLGIPEVAWAYQMVAIVPVLNGFQHFDIHRLKRQMRHLPQIVTAVLPSAVALVLVWPLFFWLPDYRLVLATMMISTVVGVLTSHAMADRAYRVSFDRTVITGALRFGWPLLINNILLFLVFQGEKMIVGRELGMVDLGILAMGFTLTLTPTLVMARSVQAFFLPQLSASQSDTVTFNHLALVTLQAALVNGCLLIVVIIAIGEPFVQMVLGEKYADLVPLMVWMAILNATRVFKAGGAVVALARGQTGNAMIANLFRVASLPLSAWAAISGEGLLTIIWIATAGEVCGVITSYLLVHLRAGVPARPMWPALACCVVVLGAAALFAGHGDLPPQIAAELPRWAVGGVAFAAFAMLVYALRDGRLYISRRIVTAFQE